MLNEVKQLMQSNSHCKVLLNAILGSPYIERQALVKKVGLPAENFEALLKSLEERLIVLELASQAEHSVESRVPKKIYAINPEMEQDIRGILGKS